MDEQPMQHMSPIRTLEDRLRKITISIGTGIPFYPHTLTFPEYPDMAFLILSRMDPFIQVAEDTPEDFRALGWTVNEETSERFLVASSQFARMVISTKDLATFSTAYIQEADLQYAEEYPVLLVNPVPRRQPFLLDQGAAIGTNGLIFHEEKVYRYTLQHLSEAGLKYHKTLSQSIKYFLPDPSADQSSKEALKHDEDSRQFYWGEMRKAAKELISLYWQYHQQQMQTKLQPSLSDVPSVNGSGIFSIPAHIALQGILGAYSNAQSGAAEWKSREQQRLAYLYSRSGNVAQVELRPTDTPAPAMDTMMESVLQQLRQFSDLDGDVLLAILAQWMAAPRDEGGYIWISIDRIQEYRGIQPRIYKASDKTEHTTGHRKEIIADINTSIKHIRDTHVTVRQWVKEERPAGKRGRPKRQVLQLESYILNITDFLQYQSLPEEGSDAPAVASNPLAVAWKCRPGECLEGFLEGDYQVAGLLQQTLSYDPYHEQWEKRLARFFTFHEDLMKEGEILCEIRGLLTELSLAPKPNQSDPQKIKRRFDKAMDRLREDKQIKDWHYVEDTNTLPSHKWLERWMDFHIDVTARSFNRISKPQKGRNRRNS